MSIRQLSRTLQVNRRWYYARLAQGEPVDPDVELRDAIEQLSLEFPGYGYRRVTHALAREGMAVNHKRVLRQTARGVAVVSPEETLRGQNDRFATWVAGLSKRAD